MKLGKKRREISKHNYYIISPRVIIKRNYHGDANGHVVYKGSFDRVQIAFVLYQKVVYIISKLKMMIAFDTLKSAV